MPNHPDGKAAHSRVHVARLHAANRCSAITAAVDVVAGAPLGVSGTIATGVVRQRPVRHPSPEGSKSYSFVNPGTAQRITRSSQGPTGPFRLPPMMVAEHGRSRTAAVREDDSTRDKMVVRADKPPDELGTPFRPGT